MRKQLETIADLLRDLVLEAPPNLTGDGWRAAIPELLGAAKLGNRLRRLTMDERRTLLELFATSAGEFLDGWFESAPIKAVLGFDGIVGNYASPYAAGSAYVLLHHVFGEVNGVKGAWGHAIGGMGAITQAMTRACEARGVTIRTDCAVAEVLVENGRAVGVVTASGDTIRAGRVISNIHPKLLYEKLIDPAVLPPEFSRRIARWKSGSGTFRMNVALSRTPPLHLQARTRPPPLRRHHPRPDPRLHGKGLDRRPPARLVKGPDRRNAHPLDPRRQPRARRANTSPACSASTSNPNCRRTSPAAPAGTTTATPSPT